MTDRGKGLGLGTLVGELNFGGWGWVDQFLTNETVFPEMENPEFILHSILRTPFFVGVWSVGRDSFPPIAGVFSKYWRGRGEGWN